MTEPIAISYYDKGKQRLYCPECAMIYKIWATKNTQIFNMLDLESNFDGNIPACCSCSATINKDGKWEA